MRENAVPAKFDFSILPTGVNKIIDRLRRRKVKFWLLGGFVRDWAGGCPTHRDIDIGVHCNVYKLQSIVGGKVVRGNHPLVKTNGCDLVPVGDLNADLRLRDFTVNAMAIGADGELIDPLGGARDAENHVFRMTRECLFEEDPVRLVRLCRLSARLGWSMDAETVAKAEACIPGLRRAPLMAHNGLRLGLELLKSFEDPFPSRFLRLAHDFRLLSLFAPHLDTCFRRPGQSDAVLARCDNAPVGNLGARMAALLKELSPDARPVPPSRSAALAIRFLREICWNYIATHIYPTQCHWSAATIALAIRLQHSDFSSRHIDWLATTGYNPGPRTLEQICRIRREGFGEELTDQEWETARKNILRHAMDPNLPRSQKQAALRFYGFSRQMAKKILDGKASVYA